MTIRRNAAATAFAAVALLIGAVGAHAKSAIADPFTRADSSFSPVPLNQPADPQAIGRLTNGDVCNDDDGIPCEWQDDAAVVHVFAGNVLAIKLMELSVADGRDFGALGIGSARNRGDVLANVRAFLPEISIDCLAPGQAGDGEAIASCGGSFENGGWIKLLFGPDNRLTSARNDAFQIN